MTQNKIIDGKEFAANLRKKIALEIAELKAITGKIPGLAVILVGADPASEVYVRNKDKSAKECGMNSYEYKMPADVSEKQLIDKVHQLNADANVHGILVQLPLPKHISESSVIDAISPEKDVDGFHAVNRGRLVAGQDSLVPCTPLGSLMLIKDKLGDNLQGLNAVVIGRSNIVGKPMAQLLINEGCTVTVCHSKTKNIEEVCARADILVVAVGKPLMVKKSWVKQGACVIDVGINRLDSGKLAGDVDYADCFEKASFITPVPGGVGPMTIACLLNNTLKAFKVMQKVNQ
jgi:methylenetetrahydrofolate dehydrogenase (NADP+)/methenyltetrahydrofolate cyclohydrolase